MTARFTDIAFDVESRPTSPDWDSHPGRPRPRYRRAPVIIGEFCPPAECLHPVEARVWPLAIGYIAACRDCGLHVLRNGRWEVAAC
jgi:hypothetical protein